MIMSSWASFLLLSWSLKGDGWRQKDCTKSRFETPRRSGEIIKGISRSLHDTCINLQEPSIINESEILSFKVLWEKSGRPRQMKTNENKYRIINQLNDILELEDGDRKDVFLQLLLPTTKKCSRKMRPQLDWRICDKVGIWSFEGPLVNISSSRAPLHCIIHDFIW